MALMGVTARNEAVSRLMEEIAPSLMVEDGLRCARPAENAGVN